MRVESAVGEVGQRDSEVLEREFKESTASQMSSSVLKKILY